jgi:L-lysine exporter family protein LysE/ArgO
MEASAFVTGLALGGSLIIAIGAQNAFVLRQGLRREHVLGIVLFCIVADMVLIAAGVYGMARVLGEARLVTLVLTIGGALFLGWYGIQALRNALRARRLVAASGTETRRFGAVLAQAAGFTLLNPHVYLDTVLLLGSIGARQPPDSRLWFVGGAAFASTAWFSALGFGARLLAPVFAHERAWRVLDVLVAVLMLSLAAMLMLQALR